MTANDLCRLQLAVMEGLYASEPEVKWSEAVKADAREGARAALALICAELVPYLEQHHAPAPGGAAGAAGGRT